ncbi:MAG: exodeoxyribonuclease V subunit beta [Desulfobulbaceae bacterium]|nr:exodeoxyribonuclease V subunit beta [Desulfobulbaceae bacterium]
MQTLDPLTIPLHGRQLIEASAGTGKTYTIALLYLRLLLEQGLNVDEILVVTFTTAATEELRSRVRSRIWEALDVLEGRSTGDRLLQAILDQAGDSPDPHQHLTDALTRMDEAAIYTIHSFCQRMLQDHAFESGAPFEVEFLESEKLLQKTIIEDFWRLRFYPATASEAAWASKTWKDPAGLLQVLDGTLSRIGVDLIPVVAADTLERLRQRCFSLFKQVQAKWPDASGEVASLLGNDSCLRRSATTYRKADRVPEILAAMNDLAGDAEMVWLLPDCLALLSASVMDTEKYRKKNCESPRQPFFDLFADFFSAHQELLRLSRIHVLQEARTYLFSELDHRKQEQSKMYFDDLLIRLDGALADPRGGQLTARIRTRFPAALVDEFQDTDPLQYRIFKQIYANPGTLFMIGDPKQAIYSFRGADIFTYLQARRDTPETARFTMDTNYRSISSMVRAVNRLFSAPAPFIFEGDIGFTPVNACDMADEQPLLIDGSSPLPMTSLLLPETLAAKPGKPIAKDRAGTAAAACCARKIAGFITAGQEGRATIGENPLTARHIAVLVRTHREADIMQRELRRLGISSVYHSLDSVFSTEAARQLHQALTAILHLGDAARIRNGLITELFGLSGPALDNLRANEQAWEEQLLTLQNYHRLWQDQGFAPMFQALLAGQRLVRRLSDRVGCERLLTDFLHLAELLAEAAAAQPGMEGLLRWFTRQLQTPDPDAGNQQLRLESDENLVQIVTMHKAKGLEYPIVFLPFLWSVRQPQKGEPISFHDPENFRLIVDLGTEMQEHRKRAQSERLAEDLRLLYVALTRARYCCYFCWGRISRMESSGLAYLLHRDNTGATILPTEEAIRKDLERLSDSEQLVAIDIDDETALPVHLKRETETTILSVKKFQGRIDTDWRITSYSGLASGHDPSPERPDYDRESFEGPIHDSGRDIYSFPRGAAAGTCLHAILELHDFSTAGDTLEPVVRAQLNTAGFDQAWTPVVCSWVDNILATRLSENLQLRLLDSRSRLNEMAFLFPLENLDINRFNRVLTSFTIESLALADSRLKGLMKGFIDLVFRFQGRYFLADYKSNYLGASPQDYQPEKLAAAMREHRYDLQYLIYSLALHRFLQSRIADYAYDRHFGGAYYLFLRGMHPENEPGTGIFTVRPEWELIRRLDLCCRGQGGK